MRHLFATESVTLDAVMEASGGGENRVPAGGVQRRHFVPAG
jgi:hypothetical protein